MTNSEKDGFWDALVFQHGNYGYAIGDSHTGVLIGDPVGDRFQTDVMTLGHGWFVDGAGCTASKEEAAFAASNSSLFVFGSRRYILGTGGRGGAHALISPLMFDTRDSDPCKKVQVPIGTQSESSGVFSLFFQDLQHGIATGGDYSKPDNDSRTAAWTSDMGQHWTAATTPPHGYRSAVAYDAPHQTWITVGPTAPTSPPTTAGTGAPSNPTPPPATPPTPTGTGTPSASPTS